MKVTVMPRKRGLSDDPIEAMFASLGFDGRSYGPMEPSKSVVDLDAVQAFCEQLGVTVDVEIIPEAGFIMEPGTDGLTQPADLDKPWQVWINDLLPDDHDIASVADIHDEDKITFSAALRHELGHVVLLSTKMREQGLSVDQLMDEHEKRANQWRTQHDYEIDQDEADADSVSLQYATVRLSVR